MNKAIRQDEINIRVAKKHDYVVILANLCPYSDMPERYFLKRQRAVRGAKKKKKMSRPMRFIELVLPSPEKGRKHRWNNALLSFSPIFESFIKLSQSNIFFLSILSIAGEAAIFLRQTSLERRKWIFVKRTEYTEYTLFSYSFSSAHLVFFLGEKRETRLVLCPEVDTARPVEMALRKIFECEYNRCPVSPLFHPPFPSTTDQPENIIQRPFQQ